jgi:hypothetical protein
MVPPVDPSDPTDSPSIITPMPSFGPAAPALVGDTLPDAGNCVGFIRASALRCVFGELGLIENQARSATVRTEEIAVLLRIAKAEFNRFVRVRDDATEGV